MCFWGKSNEKRKKKKLLKCFNKNITELNFNKFLYIFKFKNQTWVILLVYYCTLKTFTYPK